MRFYSFHSFSNVGIWGVILVLSRPSSPATSARHSTHSPSVASRTVQPKPQQLPDEQQQTPSTQQVRTIRNLRFLFGWSRSLNWIIHSFLKQQSQPQTQLQPSNQPHDISNYDQQQSGAHQRANSGPTIAISLFPESENSNCKWWIFCVYC